MLASHHPVRNTTLAVAVTLDGRPKYIIAAASGIPGSTFSGILSGRIAPSERQRNRLAETLDRSTSELFPSDNDPGPVAA